MEQKKIQFKYRTLSKEMATRLRNEMTADQPTCDISDDVNVLCADCSTLQTDTILRVHDQLVAGAWPHTRHQHTAQTHDTASKRLKVRI